MGGVKVAKFFLMLVQKLLLFFFKVDVNDRPLFENVWWWWVVSDAWWWVVEDVC